MRNNIKLDFIGRIIQKLRNKKIYQAEDPSLAIKIVEDIKNLSSTSGFIYSSSADAYTSSLLLKMLKKMNQENKIVYTNEQYQKDICINAACYTTTFYFLVDKNTVVEMTFVDKVDFNTYKNQNFCIGIKVYRAAEGFKLISGRISNDEAYVRIYDIQKKTSPFYFDTDDSYAIYDGCNLDFIIEPVDLGAILDELLKEKEKERVRG